MTSKGVDINDDVTEEEVLMTAVNDDRDDDINDADAGSGVDIDVVAADVCKENIGSDDAGNVVGFDDDAVFADCNDDSSSTVVVAEDSCPPGTSAINVDRREVSNPFTTSDSERAITIPAAYPTRCLASVRFATPVIARYSYFSKKKLFRCGNILSVFLKDQEFL